jgi:Protein kinase domain
VAGNLTAGPELELSGRQLARRYALTDEMAPGALCRIVRGDDLVLRRPVIVKAVPPAYVEMYSTALRATSALTYPVLVALYDALYLDDWLLLIQEAVSGQALARYLRQGVPSERAVNLATQLAQALAYAHHRDMIHGDLTPTAVLVDRQATIRVNNFGLPPDLDYFLAEGGSEAQALIAEGTPHGDVLALGLLLRQLLSAADLAGVEPGTRQVRDDIPDDLARIVARCTTPATADAINDAATLVLALEEFSAHQAEARQSVSMETPPLLRAMRVATADQEAWAAEPTEERPQAPLLTSLERGTHEVGSRFTRTTDPLHGGHSGQSDAAATRAANEADLAVPPRLRLPTRQYPDAPIYQQTGKRPAFSRSPTYDDPDAKGIMLGSVLILGAALFLVFFFLGFLGSTILSSR